MEPQHVVVLSRNVGIVSAEEEGSSGDASSEGESLQHQRDDVANDHNEEFSGLAMPGDTTGFGVNESSGWYSASKKDCGPRTVTKQRRPRSLSFSVVKNTNWRANQLRESAPAVPGAGAGGHCTFNYHNLAQNARSLYADRIRKTPIMALPPAVHDTNPLLPKGAGVAAGDSTRPISLPAGICTRSDQLRPNMPLTGGGSGFAQQQQEEQPRSVKKNAAKALVWRKTRNAKEKERSIRIARKIDELQYLLARGGVTLPKGTKTSILSEAARYIREMQQDLKDSHTLLHSFGRQQFCQQQQQQQQQRRQQIIAQRSNIAWEACRSSGKGVLFPEVTSWQGAWERDAMYRRVFQHNPVGMAIASLGGILLEGNQLFCNLMGYGSSEIVGQSLSIFDLIAKNDLNESYTKLHAMLCKHESNQEPLSPAAHRPMGTSASDQGTTEDAMLFRDSCLVVRADPKTSDTDRDHLMLSISLIVNEDEQETCSTTIHPNWKGCRFFCVTLLSSNRTMSLVQRGHRPQKEEGQAWQHDQRPSKNQSNSVDKSLYHDTPGRIVG